MIWGFPKDGGSSWDSMLGPHILGHDIMFSALELRTSLPTLPSVFSALAPTGPRFEERLG